MINSDGNINFMPHIQVSFEKKLERLDKVPNPIGFDKLIKISFTSDFDLFDEADLIYFISNTIKIHYMEYLPKYESYSYLLGNIVQYHFFKSIDEMWVFDKFGDIIEKRDAMPYLGAKRTQKRKTLNKFRTNNLISNQIRN